MFDFLKSNLIENPKARSVFADVLRAAPSTLANTGRAQGTLYTPGFGAAPPRVIDNSAGRMWNNVKDAAAGLSGVMNQRGEAAAQASRMDALQGILGTGARPTPQQMLELSEIHGFNPDALKMAFPDEEKLGKAQMIQYGRDAAGMRTINALQPGTFSDDAIAQAEASAKAAQQDALDFEMRKAAAGRAPREPRSMTEIDILTSGDQDLIDRYTKGKLGLKTKTGGSGGGITDNGDGTFTFGDPSSSMSNQDRKFAAEAQENADKASVQSESIGRITGRLANVATTPDAKNKLAQIAANNDFNSIAEMIRTPDAFANASEVIGLAIGDARALAPVSNTDFDKLLARYPSALTEPTVAAAFFEELDRQSRGAFERNSNNAVYHTLRADGYIPPGMTVSGFRSKMSKPPKDFPEDQKKYWDSMAVDERYEQYRQHGGIN